MKIKFVFPPAFDEAKLSMLPYGMCVLAGYLKRQGFNVEQEDIMIKLRRMNIPRNIFKRPFNMNLIRDSKKVARYLFYGKEDKRLSDFSKRMVELTKFESGDTACISVHSIFQFPFALLIAKYIKDMYGSLVIMGGPFITLRGAEFIKKALFVDYMVQGEGEIPMKCLLEAVINKNKTALEGIPGLIYRKNDEIFVNERSYMPIEEMSPPDFAGLKLDLYKYVINGKPEVIFTYQFTKGCKGRCSFCTHHVISNVLQTKSPEKVVRELKEICIKHNAKYFYICDSSVNSNYDELKEICEAIKEEGLAIFWGSLGRLDNITDELAKSLKESGCKFLRFGFESGSDRILKVMGKAHTVETALTSVKNMHKHGIKSLGTFIAGFPGETDSDIAMTKDFIRKISPYVFELACGVCFIEPKSNIQINPENFGIKNLRLKNQDFINYEEMPREIFAFDEIGGLGWKRKKRQQIISHRIVTRDIKRLIVNKHKENYLARWLPFFTYYFFGENKYKNRILSYLYALIKKDYYYNYSNYYTS